MTTMRIGRADRTVASIMTADPVAVPVQASIPAVADLFESYRISGAPVVDDDGVIVGVISQTDLVRLCGAERPGESWHAARVADLMTSPALTIAMTEPVSAAARRMIELGVHRLVVLDAAGEPNGVLSESDIVREIAERCDE